MLVEDEWAGPRPASRLSGVDAPRRRRRHATLGYGRASAVAAVLAGCVFASLLLTDPLLHAAPHTFYYFFYDLQAHSLLHFHWNVPAGSLGNEAFIVHGKTYEYFGPLPALLRLPFVAFTNRLDGKLSQPSMLIAFALLMLFTVRLATRLRPLVRGDSAITAGERWAFAIFTFAVGAGSAVIFLASRAWVYHEDLLWAAALALGAFEFVLAFTSRPTTKNLVLASAFTTATMLTRVVAGAGPLVALAIVCCPILLSRRGRFVGLGQSPSSTRFRLLCVGALGVPVGLACAVNYAKFGSLFSIPWESSLSAHLPFGIENVVDHNGGSLLGSKFVLQNLVEYLRPDAVRPSTWFPWLQFGPAPHTASMYTPTSSLTTSMPAFTVLAAVGVVGAIRGHRLADSKLAVLRAPLLGACVTWLGVLATGWIANRYLVDFLPGLVVMSLAGLHLTLRWSSTLSRRAVRRVWTALVVLVAFGTWTSLSVAILYARSLEPHTPPQTRSSFLKLQHTIHDFFTIGSISPFAVGSTHPASQTQLPAEPAAPAAVRQPASRPKSGQPHPR